MMGDWNEYKKVIPLSLNWKIEPVRIFFFSFFPNFFFLFFVFRWRGQRSSSHSIRAAADVFYVGEWAVVSSAYTPARIFGFFLSTDKKGYLWRSAFKANSSVRRKNVIDQKRWFYPHSSTDATESDLTFFISSISSSSIWDSQTNLSVHK